VISRVGVTAAKVIGCVFIFALWQTASVLLGPNWVPGIDAVLMRLLSEAEKGTLFRDIAATGILFACGTLIGLVLGSALACILRLSSRVDQMLQPFITAVMSVPKLGLVPLLVLWFGTGWLPKVGLVSLTVLFIVFSLTYSGIAAIDQRLVMTARVLGATSRQVTRRIVLPSLWPFVLTGLEVALPWALSAAIVAEYLSSQLGVGHAIEQARQMSDAVGVFYGIVLATALVLICNGGIAVLRHTTIKGRQEDQ